MFLGVTVVEMAAWMTAICKHMQRITIKQGLVCIEPYLVIETLTRLKFCKTEIYVSSPTSQGEGRLIGVILIATEKAAQPDVFTRT